MAQLPTVGGSNNTWGDLLNEYLLVSLDSGGAIRPAAIVNKIDNAGSYLTVTNVWVGSQSAYNGLSPNATTLYFIE